MGKAYRICPVAVIQVIVVLHKPVIQCTLHSLCRVWSWPIFVCSYQGLLDCLFLALVVRFQAFTIHERQKRCVKISDSSGTRYYCRNTTRAALFIHNQTLLQHSLFYWCRRLPWSSRPELWKVALAIYQQSKQVNSFFCIVSMGFLTTSRVKGKNGTYIAYVVNTCAALCLFAQIGDLVKVFIQFDSDSVEPKGEIYFQKTCQSMKCFKITNNIYHIYFKNVFSLIFSLFAATKECCKSLKYFCCYNITVMLPEIFEI